MLQRNLRVVVACRESLNEERSFHQRFTSSKSDRLTIEFVEFDLAESSSLEGLALSQFDVIFVCADESEAFIDADSRTMLVLFLLQEIKVKRRTWICSHR